MLRHTLSKMGKITALLVLTATGLPSHGATAEVTAKLDRSLSAIDGLYGNCMVRLDADIMATGLNCPSPWVSFSCSGDFAAKDEAMRMFDSAQLALVTNTTVQVRVHDHLMHNGKCVSSRVQVIR